MRPTNQPTTGADHCIKKDGDPLCTPCCMANG